MEWRKDATVYALAVIELKNEGHNIKLHCVLPCDNYQCGYYSNRLEVTHWAYLEAP